MLTAWGRWVVALLVCSIGASTDLIAQPSNPHGFSNFLLDSWSDANGLPMNSVHSIVQGVDGFLWVGTEQGIARFDGAKFQIFDSRSTPAMSVGFSRSLLATSDSSIWVGLQGGGLVRIKNSRATRIRTFDGDAAAQVFTVATGGPHRIWIGTQGFGLVELRDSVKRYSTANGLANDFVTAVYQQGEVTWIGTRGGLSRMEKGLIRNFTVADGLPSDGVTYLAKSRSGDVLVATTKGLARIRSDRIVGVDLPEFVRNGHIATVLEDSRGIWWVGLHGGGLAKIDSTGVARMLAADGLGTNLVRSLYEDREGSIWIGTIGGGLHRFRPTRVRRIGRREGLPVEIALPILQDSRGRMWIGSAGGGVTRFEGNKATVIDVAQGLSHNVVLSLAEDRDGSILVGTPISMDRIVGNVATPAGLIKSGLPVRVILLDSHQRLWVGTEGRGVVKVRPLPAVEYPISDGLGQGIVESLAEAPDGSLWIGTREGLRRLRDGRIEELKEASGLGSVQALHFDRTGALWIGKLDGQFLGRFKDGKLTRITRADGLLETQIHAIVEDREGGFWTSSDRGIFWIDKESLDRRADSGTGAISVQAFTTANGLASREANGGVSPAAFLAKNGEVWFPTVKGAVAVDPSTRTPRLVPPQVAVGRISVNNATDIRIGPTSINDLRPIGPDVRSLLIEYSALTFVIPEKVRFRFRLHGADSGWTETSERSVRYTNLAPGSYTFRVTAANAEGVWSRDTADVKFSVKATLLQTLPAKILAVLALGLLMGGAGTLLQRARIANLVRERGALASALAEKTRAEESYRDLFENAIDAVFTVGNDGRLREFNHEFQDLSGYDRHEMIDMDITNLVGTDSVITEFDREQEAVPLHHLLLFNKTGRLVPLEASIRRINRNGENEGIQVIARDVTERSRLEFQLQQSQKMNAIGQLASGIAHDFNNLLTVIRGNAEFVGLQVRGNESAVTDIEELLKATDTASSLTRQLLTFSRGQRVKHQVVDVNEVIENSIGMLSRLIAENIEIVTSLQPALPAVLADASQLQQVLVNLVVNASAAMPSGGKMWISTRVCDSAPGESRPHIELTFRDSGTGMTDEVRSRIFEPFFSTKESGKGTGLGLSTVYAIVEQASGKIDVESAPGRGTTFRITVPQADPEMVKTQSSEANKDWTRRGDGKTVLVVEDKEDVRGLIRRILETAGFRVVMADDGDDAIRAYEREDRIDLVITDVMMPGRSGGDVVRELRRQTPALPVVYVTGYSDDEMVNRHIQTADELVIFKPFTFEGLLSAAFAALQKARSSS